MKDLQHIMGESLKGHTPQNQDPLKGFSCPDCGGHAMEVKGELVCPDCFATAALEDEE